MLISLLKDCFTYFVVNVKVGFQFESYTVREHRGPLTVVIAVESVNNEDTVREVDMLLSYSSIGVPNPGMCICSYTHCDFHWQYMHVHAGTLLVLYNWNQL